MKNSNCFAVIAFMLSMIVTSCTPEDTISEQEQLPPTNSDSNNYTVVIDYMRNVDNIFYGTWNSPVLDTSEEGYQVWPDGIYGNMHLDNIFMLSGISDRESHVLKKSGEIEHINLSGSYMSIYYGTAFLNDDERICMIDMHNAPEHLGLLDPSTGGSLMTWTINSNSTDSITVCSATLIGNMTNVCLRARIYDGLPNINKPAAASFWPVFQFQNNQPGYEGQNEWILESFDAIEHINVLLKSFDAEQNVNLVMRFNHVEKNIELEMTPIGGTTEYIDVSLSDFIN